jgi:hypothetical protein
MNRLGLLMLLGILGSGLPASAEDVGSMDTRRATIHELRGIKALRIRVDGLSGPIEGTEVSDSTLEAQLKNQVSKAGLAVITEPPGEAPTLHVRVLPIQGTHQNFFIITAALEESCRVSRAGGVEVPLCATWSIYPRLGVFGPGDVSVLVGQFMGVGRQFVDAWSSDNPRPGK